MPVVKQQETRHLTPLESLVMDAVWRRPDATVRQVRDDLQPVKPMAYNTVLTVMRILRDKGYLDSQRRGKADVYRAKVSQDQTARRGLLDLLHRFFAGSPAQLVSHLLDTHPLDPDELKSIRRQVNQRLIRRDLSRQDK
ncbi:MAG: BlaI/MecI/CopY family transcriptional regulator [Phycisphaeraceae bacterium]|nr:BlaI/MecI/CopY family transcriptional regulator [Phycisphaeraceae bacterium]